MEWGTSLMKTHLNSPRTTHSKHHLQLIIDVPAQGLITFILTLLIQLWPRGLESSELQPQISYPINPPNPKLPSVGKTLYNTTENSQSRLGYPHEAYGDDVKRRAISRYERIFACNRNFKLAVSKTSSNAWEDPICIDVREAAPSVYVFYTLLESWNTPTEW